jgi:hypothetical protein
MLSSIVEKTDSNNNTQLFFDPDNNTTKTRSITLKITKIDFSFILLINLDSFHHFFVYLKRGSLLIPGVPLRYS